jgi:hypothetical protein
MEVRPVGLRLDETIPFDRVTGEATDLDGHRDARGMRSISALSAKVETKV